MIINDQTQYIGLINLRTRNQPEGIDIPTIFYCKVKSFNTETKEAEIYGQVPIIEVHKDGSQILRNETVLFSPTGNISLIKGDLEVAILKCHLPYAKLYWKNTDIEIVTEDQLNFPPKEARSL